MDHPVVNVHFVHPGTISRSETDNCEENVVQDEGDVDQGHDDPFATCSSVSGGQGNQAPEAAQQLHARGGSWVD